MVAIHADLEAWETASDDMAWFLSGGAADSYGIIPYRVQRPEEENEPAESQGKPWPTIG